MKDKIISKLEKFGRASLIPISILPIAGIILGLGNAFTTDAIRETLPFLNNDILVFIFGLLKVIGKSAFDNLPLFFAVGIAIGLSKKTKATAGLSALVGYLTFIWVLSYTLEARGMLVDTETMNEVGQKLVLGKQVMDLNVFGGIIIGLLGYYANKHFASIRFSPLFSFFEGEKFVPFVMMVFGTLAAIISAFVWPIVGSWITVFSEALNNLGVWGPFLYGAGERLLIPFGLHHVLNSLISYTEFGGAMDICGQTYYGNFNMFAGALDCGAPITPEMSKYFSGTFIVKMFGLPGAALAMYHTAAPKHKKMIGSLMISAAATSILVGITEPLEFTFLFVAPVLYIVHAVLSGFAFMVMDLTQTALISMQGTGLVNFVLFDVMNTENVNWFNTLWIGPMFFVIYYFVFKTLIIKLNLKTPGREDEFKGFATKQDAKDKYNLKSQTVSINDDEKVEDTQRQRALKLIEAHGGQDNIKEVANCISRLRINVKDLTKVDKDIIKDELGANGVAIVADQVQSVYGPEAKFIKGEINDIMGIEY